jgi:alkylation response protein AidB-like acyl-CoA dehydrogenase
MSETYELDPTSDFYALELVLADRDRAFLKDVRAFMRSEVAPIINDYWAREEFPHQVFGRAAEIGMGGMALEGYGCAGRGVLVDGFVAMELAAVD